MENDKLIFNYKIVISLVILAVLVIQAAFIPARILTGFTGEWFWPFIDYPMYDKAHFENEHVEVTFVLEVSHKDGSTVKLDERDLGLAFWNYYRLTNNLQKGEGRAVDIFLQLYPRSDTVREIRVYSSPYIVTRQGKAVSAPVLLRHITL